MFAINTGTLTKIQDDAYFTQVYLPQRGNQVSVNIV